MRDSVLILLLLLSRVDAQQASKATNPTDSFTGVVRNISLENNGNAATLSIESGRGRIPHQIHCTASTRITKAGKPVLLVQLKKGRAIECAGTLKGDALEAATCAVH
jgi:hypothetical protein